MEEPPPSIGQCHRPIGCGDNQEPIHVALPESVKNEDTNKFLRSGINANRLELASFVEDHCS